MAVLESGYEWLEFPDHQYLEPADRPTPSDVAPVLGVTIAEFDPTVGVLPDGPRQPRSRDGARRLPAGARRSSRTREWFCYEDHGYKHIPGLLAWRVAKLLRAHPWPTPAIVPARARRGAQAPRHLVLHLADRAARAGPRAQRTHGGPRPRAVLAPGPAAGRVGRAGRLHLIPGAQRPARGESGGPSTPTSLSLRRCGLSARRRWSADRLTPPIVVSRRPVDKGCAGVHMAETQGASSPDRNPPGRPEEVRPSSVVHPL